MPRSQFSLKTLLWLLLVVAAFFAGARWERNRMIAAGWFYIEPQRLPSKAGFP